MKEKLRGTKPGEMKAVDAGVAAVLDMIVKDLNAELKSGKNNPCDEWYVIDAWDGGLKFARDVVLDYLRNYDNRV